MASRKQKCERFWTQPGTGEVPAEQVAKARRIVEHAKSVLSSTPGGKKGKKKKGKK